MKALLSRWLGLRKSSDPVDLTVTVYTRAGCGCCQKAIDLLKRHQRGRRFRIKEIDVDGDPELAAQYGLTVPVVAIDGKVRFKGIVNPVLLERLLLAESG